MNRYCIPVVRERQPESLSPVDLNIFLNVQAMIELMYVYPERAEHFRADIAAYTSEMALTNDGHLRGALITMLVYRFPGYIDLRPIADALGVSPSSLRLALGLDGVK